MAGRAWSGTDNNAGTAGTIIKASALTVRSLLELTREGAKVNLISKFASTFRQSVAVPESRYIALALPLLRLLPFLLQS